MKLFLVVLSLVTVAANARTKPEHRTITKIRAECSDRSLNTEEIRRAVLLQGKTQESNVYTNFYEAQLQMAKASCLHRMLLEHYHADARMDGLHTIDNDLLLQLHSFEESLTSDRTLGEEIVKFWLARREDEADRDYETLGAYSERRLAEIREHIRGIQNEILVLPGGPLKNNPLISR